MIFHTLYCRLYEIIAITLNVSDRNDIFILDCKDRKAWSLIIKNKDIIIEKLDEVNDHEFAANET